MAISAGKWKGYVAHPNQKPYVKENEKPVKNPVFSVTYEIGDLSIWPGSGRYFNPVSLVAASKPKVTPKTSCGVYLVPENPPREITLTTMNDVHAALASLQEKLGSGNDAGQLVDASEVVVLASEF